MIIKPLDRTSGEAAVFGTDLSSAESAALHARVAAQPQRYVAQQWVRVSQAPAFERGTGERPGSQRDQLSARTVGLRVFAVATPGGYRVMPGGLTRVAGADDARVIAMQHGGRSKDTWVLSEGPVNASFSLLSTMVGADDLVHTHSTVSSRAAENLFWFGRYGERCDATARLLRVAISSVLGDSAQEGDGLAPVLALAVRQGVLQADESPGGALLRAATHPEEGLGAELRRLARVAFNLRDRMSSDNWRALNRLIADPVFRRGLASSPQLPLALGWLDRAVTSMMTLSGYVLDGMTRGIGWRFLSIGRRIERLTQLCAALEVASSEGRSSGLAWLLELTDSSMTYRTRYPVAPEWMPVLDLLLRDDTNPRSVAFQVKGLVEYVDKLELAHGRFASDVLAPGLAAFKALAAADLHPESAVLATLLDQLGRAARNTSDELSLKFFSHAAARSVLSLVA